MNPATQRIVSGIRKAIQAEGDGFNFYTMAANSTKDSKGQMVFRQLAEEEKEHVAFLRHQYESLIKNGRIDTSKTLSQPSTLSGSSPIFSEKLRDRIGESHMEMSALSIGIQLELNAINFYKAQATEANDQDVKKFYRELVDWETGHYHALLRQQEALREAYWSENGFSPF